MSTYGILAEDESDVETLKVLIRRLNTKQNMPRFRGKGYGGCGELLKKGARDLRMLSAQCTRLVVCYDSDKSAAEQRREQLFHAVVRPASVPVPTCMLVPVQEIEAWFLADLSALGKTLPKWRGEADRDYPNPETQTDPKELLQRITRLRGRPLYANAVHNPIIAQHLDLRLVRERCPSFVPLQDLVQAGRGNCP